ncbi:MAG TPA: alpha/beta fold hydrolase [Stellaceae bacterium]|nr:alpha/beta fold hydrolase [Stellaceae bacterium]
MLIPVQTGGSKPPLILMHGMFGVLPWRRGRALAEFLGPDQPLYGIEAPGFDGSRKPRAKVPEAANDYLAEIRRARLQPPFVVTGVCGGCIMALQLAQNLAVAAQYAGEPPPVPLLILIDPPALPGYEFNPSELADAADLLRDRVGNWFLEARSRLEEIPFDIGDPKQLATATEVGAAVEWSISTYHPTPYAGPVQVLAIEPIAQMVDRPHWPWRKVLVGSWGLGTLQCKHYEIFTTHAPEVFKWVKGRLDELRPSAGSPIDERPAAGP